MPRYKMLVGGSASSDAAVVAAKERGFQVVALATLAEHTKEQIGEGNDSWVRFTAGCPGIMKVVETSLVSGVLSSEHIARNASLLAEHSERASRHGLGGIVSFLEPMWLPGWWYKQHPEMRGARCDNPCLALHRYYAPCIDHPAILAHYREATKKLLEIAPSISVITLSPNDSGSGICWCSGLYPGPNGNPACKDVAFGDRVAGWLQAILDGAADAGKSIEVVISPVHFSRGEKEDTLTKLPRGGHLAIGRDNFPNIPFFDEESVRLIRESKRRRRGAMVSVNPTLVAWLMEPVTEMPVPYFILDAWREAGRVDADILSVAGISEPVLGMDTVPTMAVTAGFNRPPRSNAEIDRIVARIAREQVGPKLAKVLVSAWRDVDHALRLWPNNADTNHHLYPKYSIIGDRWLVRPLVPAARMLSSEEKAYYSKERHRGRLLSQKEKDAFFIVESTKNYKTAEFKWLVAIYDEMMDYMNRAVRDMKAALDAPVDDEMARIRFALQYDRVRAARAIWRTQRNVLRCGSIIEFFTGPDQDEYWHVIRKDESFYEPATYRRLFLEAMDDEIANCREMIELMRGSDIVLFSTGEEQSFVLPRNLPEQLEMKMAVMEAHKKDIDVLFPDVPPETFADPTYEWADRTTEDAP